MNKVNIKGCAGFIGSNLASLMLNEGYTVWVFTTLTPANQNDMSHVKANISVEKDILDYEPQYKSGKGINLFFEWYIENNSIYERRGL